ncbi:hypothetical protein GCM10009527_036550 [Actinomadura nitritigenes]|uniref:Uncharacterized protein n=1 Tax=Actinomadura nitritigenes TaxID=134602 RepID=A0ABS3QY00_9ACTN|nr:hypothetical protein [Actinomadura nitritigenes]MBO2438870.1 hypothetical protein [Actinomadura nitritigenes]
MTLPRRLVSAAAALGVATGLLAGPVSATAADAATVTFRIQVPKRLTVKKTDKYDKNCYMDVWVWGAEGPTVAYSNVYLVEPTGHIEPVITYRKVLPGYQVGWGVGCPPKPSDTGRYTARVVAYDRSGKKLATREESWYEKFDTAVGSFNAAPEPVRKGGTLTVSGRLYRLNDRATGYTSYPGKTMRIYFRPKGAKTWTYMGSAKTAGDGRFRKGFKASRDGTWRAYFPGTSHCDKQASRDDYVDVK